MKVNPREYLALELRAHTFLADVPLHDVWRVELAGGEADRTVLDARRCFVQGDLTSSNFAVRALFKLREGLGDLFGWDDEEPGYEAESYIHRLTDADREASLVAPGTPDGFFRTLYVFPYESVNEVRNATVHAFLVLALVPKSFGYTLYWAIYVKPVSRFTGAYMALIDPFRRWLVYPAILDRVRRAWKVSRSPANGERTVRSLLASSQLTSFSRLRRGSWRARCVARASALRARQ